MFAHVHNSRYFDYVLAARYDQMARFYKVPMEEFLKLGFGWVVRSATIDWKRPLGLGDFFTVQTWIDEILNDGVKVRFVITRRTDRKVACEGICHYTMIDIASGKAERIPEWIVEKYSV
jgi:acyl-CoA thioester hydrolase/thioesterase-3